jgi:hypothetical protein
VWKKTEWGRGTGRKEEKSAYSHGHFHHGQSRLDCLRAFTFVPASVPMRAHCKKDKHTQRMRASGREGGLKVGRGRETSPR